MINRKNLIAFLRHSKMPSETCERLVKVVGKCDEKTCAQIYFKIKNYDEKLAALDAPRKLTAKQAALLRKLQKVFLAQMHRDGEVALRKIENLSFKNFDEKIEAAFASA